MNIDHQLQIIAILTFISLLFLTVIAKSIGEGFAIIVALSVIAACLIHSKIRELKND
jgi:hypothetical protein